MSSAVATAGPSTEGASSARLGRLWLAGVAAALALYVLTLAPGLVWQDSGDYQLRAATLDLSRPGDAVRVHPWLLAVAWALGRTGLWNYAYAANLASAVGTALAVGNVLVLARVLTGRAWPAVVAATTFALGHAVWAHAVQAETYGWTAAFLSAECLAAWAYLGSPLRVACPRPARLPAGGSMRGHGHAPAQNMPTQTAARHWAGRPWACHPRGLRWMVALFLINGIAISNHMMAGLAAAVWGVWMAAEIVRRRAPGWILPASAAAWLAGGTLYWIVLAREYAHLGSVAATVRSATVGAWGANIFNLADLPGLLGKSLMYIGLNYPTPLAAGIVVGAVVLVRRREAMGVLLVVLAAVYLAWAARYNVADQYAFFVPFYVPASVMIGVACGAVWPGPRRIVPWVLVALAVLPVAVYAALPAAAQRAGVVFFKRELPYREPYTHFLQPWKRGDDGARRFATEVLESLPEGAVLLADSTAWPPLACLQLNEGVRPDVTLASPLDPPWTTAYRLWYAKESPLASLAAEGKRVFSVSDQPGYVPRWMAGEVKFRPFGLIYECNP